jgi:chromosomal replication initiation ATPase DnaA
MIQDKNISKMLVELGATAEIVGVERLTQILKEIRKNEKNLTVDEYQTAMQIIEIVCTTYDITIDDFYSNKRKNNRRYALSSVFFVLNKKLNYDYEKISIITKKPFSIISILIKEISEMDKKHPFDNQILTKLDEIVEKTNMIKKETIKN